jgi:mannose-6-phosphate isomerase-like protein (cupin superfamily)
VFDTSVTYNSYDPSSPWKIGLINAIQCGDGSFTKSCAWTFQQISDQSWYVLQTNMGAAKGPLVSTIDRHEEGNSAIREEFLYDIAGQKIYGLASKAFKYVNGSELPTNYKTTEYYFLVYPDYEAKHLLQLPYIEKQYAGDSTLQKERKTYYCHETGKYGVVDHIAILKEGSTYCEWTYSYICPDPQGKYMQIWCSGPDDSFTNEEYNYGVKTSCTFGDTSIFHRVVSVYDSSIRYEISQDGATFYYNYDALGRVVLFGFASGQELTEHTSTQHATVQVLSGECEMDLARETHHLKAGDYIYMPPGLPHAVRAKTQFSMLLTLLKP